MSPRRRQCDHNLAGSKRQWRKFGWEKTSVTRIWLWIDVSFGHTDVYSQPNCGHWHFLAAKFWSLTYPCIQILVTDFCCQPNSGHTDVFSETCITRIFSFLSWFEAEKGFSCFLKTSRTEDRACYAARYLFRYPRDITHHVIPHWVCYVVGTCVIPPLGAVPWHNMFPCA